MRYKIDARSAQQLRLPSSEDSAVLDDLRVTNYTSPSLIQLQALTQEETLLWLGQPKRKSTWRMLYESSKSATFQVANFLAIPVVVVILLNNPTWLYSPWFWTAYVLYHLAVLSWAIHSSTLRQSHLHYAFNEQAIWLADHQEIVQIPWQHIDAVDFVTGRNGEGQIALVSHKEPPMQYEHWFKTTNLSRWEIPLGNFSNAYALSTHMRQCCTAASNSS